MQTIGRRNSGSFAPSAELLSLAYDPEEQGAGCPGKQTQSIQHSLAWAQLVPGASGRGLRIDPDVAPTWCEIPACGIRSSAVCAKTLGLMRSWSGKVGRRQGRPAQAGGGSGTRTGVSQ